MTLYRFRLLSCDQCGRRWMVDNEFLPAHEPNCPTKIWLEAHTFFADDYDGPGFPLRQYNRPL